MSATTTTRNLARMARVDIRTVNRYILRGLLVPAKTGKKTLFDDAYARRVAPLLGTRVQLAHILLEEP